MEVEPPDLEKNAVEYRVVIQTDQGEELSSREVHTPRERVERRFGFTDDDFALLDEDALLSAKVSIDVVGNNEIEGRESEEFVIRFGEPPEKETGGVGTKVRTLSEGLPSWKIGKPFRR